MKFKRGDKVIDSEGYEGTVLGSEDFEGYERNKPNDGWELVLWEDGNRLWTASKWLKLRS